MPDQSEAPIVRKLLRRAGEEECPNLHMCMCDDEGSHDTPINPDGPEAAEIIRLCEEALEEVRKCGNGGARLTRTASDMVRRALAKIRGQNP